MCMHMKVCVLLILFVHVCIPLFIRVGVCVCATGMHVINSRGVLIIGTVNKSATDMFIFTVSVQITKEADASTNIAQAKLIFI